MNIENLFPYAAGSPPAVVLGIHLYNAILTASGAQFWWIAAPVAFLGVIGMIATEVYTYQMAARAFALKAWGALFLAMLGAVLVSGFVIFGVYTGTNTKSLISNTVIAIAAYLTLAIKKYLDTLKMTEAEETNSKINILTAQRLLNNSEARKIKASATVVQPSTSASIVSTVHTGQFQADPALIATIQSYWKANPKASLRVAANACKCSPTTAGKYKP